MSSYPPGWIEPKQRFFETHFVGPITCEQWVEIIGINRERYIRIFYHKDTTFEYLHKIICVKHDDVKFYKDDVKNRDNIQYMDKSTILEIIGNKQQIYAYF